MAAMLTLEELQERQALLDEGKINEFYSVMLDDGYAYAGWAKGVADGDSIAGVAATDFLTGSAMMGAGGAECQSLTSEQVEKIKREMAQAYLDALVSIAKDSDGKVERDIRAQEVWKFHEKVFTENNLTIANWTLDVPFRIIQKVGGDDALERAWQEIRDTKGGGMDAWVANVMIFAGVYGRTLFSSDAEVRQWAEDWMELVPGFDDALGLMSGAVDGTLNDWADSELASSLGLSGALVSIGTTIAELFSETETTGAAQAVGMLLASVAKGATAAEIAAQEAEIASAVAGIARMEQARASVDSVRRLLYGASVPATPASDGKALLENVLEVIVDANVQQKFTIESLAGASAAGLVEAAKQADADKALAYRYALRELNPFAVVGPNYAPLNANGELDLYDPQTGNGELSEQYLYDRGEMLGYDLELGKRSRVVDRSLQQNIAFHDAEAGRTLLVDRSSNTSVDPTTRRDVYFGGDGNDAFAGHVNDDHLYGGHGDDRLYGAGGHDHLEGGAGTDFLVGGEGKDALSGGRGNDTLEGGDGDDTLTGGRGNDRYEFSGAFGRDVVIDADGAGEIWIDGVRLGVFSADGQDASFWTGDDGLFLITRIASGIGSSDLLISRADDSDDSIVVRGWSAGELGISLPTPGAVAPSPTIRGDYKKRIDVLVDAYGNPFDVLVPVRDPVWEYKTGFAPDGDEAGAMDVIAGTVGADSIFSLGGNDAVAGASLAYWVGTLRAAEHTRSVYAASPYGRHSGGSLTHPAFDLYGMETANGSGNPSVVANAPWPIDGVERIAA